MRFREGLKIPKYFGDFGGDYSERDTVVPEKKKYAEYLEALLPSAQFESRFNEILNVICPEEIKISKYEASNGKTVYCAPALSRYYVVAGYLAVKTFNDKTKAVMGTYSKSAAVAFIKGARHIGITPKLCLSLEQIHDECFRKEIECYEPEIDDETCESLFNTPYAYVNFDQGMGYEVIPVDANYGPYPQAALTGLFASLYSYDLKAEADKLKIDTAVCSITTGTEAVGSLKAFIGEIKNIATAEETVSKEYHLEDSGSYTLSTRNAQRDVPDITICPELAYWWRMAKLCRLGCDRIFPVDISAYKGLSDKGARAAAIAFEAFDTDELLLVEEDHYE